MKTTDEHETGRGDSGAIARRALVVTGATGWLGRAIVELWAAGGYGPCDLWAIALDAEESNLSSTTGPGRLRPRNVDLRSADKANRLVNEVHRITGSFDLIHAAGIIHPERLTDLDFNVTSTRNLDMAMYADDKFVYVSSTAADDTGRCTDGPQMGYGRSKRRGELLVEQRQGRWAIARAPWFYGSNHPERQERFLRACAEGKFPVPTGTQLRSMVEVGALASGLAILVREVESRTVSFCDPQSYTPRMIIEAVREASLANGRTVSKRTHVTLPVIFTRAAEMVDVVIQKLGLYVPEIHVIAELGRTITDVPNDAIELGWDPGPGLVSGMSASMKNGKTV